MLYNLLLPYAEISTVANLLTTNMMFRSFIAFTLSICICFCIANKFIIYFRKIYIQGQPIRSYTPKTHLQKAGTPTMGGIIIIVPAITSTLLLSNINNPYIWICIISYIAFSILGFIDDYIKVSQQHHKGVHGKIKLITQCCISFFVFFAAQKYMGVETIRQISIPFLKNTLIDLGYFYIPFVLIVIIGSSNALNLTDGLDGLAAGTAILSILAFGIIAYLVGSLSYASYLKILYIPDIQEASILCAAIIGSTLGFLWFNAIPAQIFMGDTGSLGLGGLIGTIAVITKHEILLSIIGSVFVMETLSVIIQVYCFKITGGKRVFLMAPIHHHFEKIGWSESKIVIRFWIISLISFFLGLISLAL